MLNEMEGMFVSQDWELGGSPTPVVATTEGLTQRWGLLRDGHHF